MIMTEEWLMARIEPEPNSGCWLWISDVSKKGYGAINLGATHIGKRRYRAHLAVYEVIVGPTPPGLTADHLCRVRSCVNPRHLEFVTNKVNALRGVSFAAVNAKKTACLRGHAFNEANTLIRHRRSGAAWRRCRPCARLLGKSRPSRAIAPRPR